ncbi:MAG: ATP-binding cassette domain-containing protein, partial [Candidatus Humimicrobiaceae bacterium]
RIIYNKKAQKDLCKKIGIVFQDPNDQLFSADVHSDIAFGPLNMGMSESETKKVVYRVIEQLDITDYMNRPIHALSFGQKKRVAIAGILAMEPEVMILDEPTAGLDPSGVSETLKLMMKLKKENGLTILLSTHDMDIVPLYSDYVYILNHGRVANEGTCKEILAESDKIRSNGLRLPRLAHLMEIMRKVDNLPVDQTAATISAARKSIKSLLQIKL